MDSQEALKGVYFIEFMAELLHKTNISKNKYTVLKFYAYSKKLLKFLFHG